jgi:hypothetical protein
MPEVEWTGELEHFFTERGEEVTVVVLSNGGRIEMWADGISLLGSERMVTWAFILEQLEANERTIVA